MKKALIALSITLTLVGCGSDIDTVKNGMVEFNKTTSVGRALDNWESCRHTQWESFESINGTVVVQFTCTHDIAAYLAEVKNLAVRSGNNAHLDLLTNKQIFQFTLNNDDTFQVDNVQIESIWRDGIWFGDSQKAIQQLQSAYDNDIFYDISRLNPSRANQVSRMFKLQKLAAK